MQNPRITVVQAPGCHFCADAQRVLTDFAEPRGIDIELLDARDPRGTALMQEHRVAMSPLVLVDGQFFSQGRVPRGKLRALAARWVAA
ncbi:MAG: thioredoxin family protein [Candidatus Nanopelagicales bacterium]